VILIKLILDVDKMAENDYFENDEIINRKHTKITNRKEKDYGLHRKKF
jgi:hypothetical protein